MALDVADLVDRTEVFVFHPRLDLGFAEEAFDLIGVVSAKELERNETTEAEIARLVDIAHAAAADKLDELVAVPIGDWKYLERIVGMRLPPRWADVRGASPRLETELASEAASVSSSNRSAGITTRIEVVGLLRSGRS